MKEFWYSKKSKSTLILNNLSSLSLLIKGVGHFFKSNFVFILEFNTVQCDTIQHSNRFDITFGNFSNSTQVEWKRAVLVQD